MNKFQDENAYPSENDERKAEKLLDQVHVATNKGNWEKALNLYKIIIEKFPNTLTSHNYAIDQYISNSVFYEKYDEAIWACEMGIGLMPERREGYISEKNSILALKSGDKKGAIDIRLMEAEKRGMWHSEIVRFADEYAILGHRDKAWGLLNKATSQAMKDGISPHGIRQKMAKFLSEEGKYLHSVDILIHAVFEAKQYSPKGVTKSLSTDLKKALKKAGVIDPNTYEKLIGIIESQNVQAAKSTFRELLNRKA